jgi:hypothetical protein
LEEVAPVPSNTHADHEPDERVRVPADVDREDQLIAGLTSRQTAYVAAAGMLGWLIWEATRELVPPLVQIGAAMPVVALAAVFVLGRRDGLPMDRFLLAAIRHSRTPARQVYAPEGVPATPAMLDPAVAAAAGPAPAPGRPLAHGIADSGTVNLGSGSALLAAVGTVNFTLRTPAEQDALAGAFGAWLNSLDAPVQILVRADRADVAAMVADLRAHAPALPHPALESAALDHADFLATLSRTRDLMHRQVLLVHHQPTPRTGSTSTGSTGVLSLLARRSAGRRERGRRDPAVAEQVARTLMRRCLDAARLLSGADVSVQPLDGGATTQLLAEAIGAATSVSSVTSTHADASAGQGDDALVPASVQIGPRWLDVNGDHLATLAVTGYPAEVSQGWLETLLSFPGRLDVTMHIEPVPQVVAAQRLASQRARLESTRRHAAARDRLQDPEVEAAAQDATDLAYAVARGQTRLFRVGLYLTVHSPTREQLDADLARVRAVAESQLLRLQPVTWRSLPGWISTLPLGQDCLKLRRTLDTAALAAAFPFAAPDLPATDPATPGTLHGVLYGENAASSGLVVWDRWSQDNHNSVILARSGAGKSYLAKLEILRSLYTGASVMVVDPEDEYARLADAVGGTVLHLGRSGVRFNPLDLGTSTDMGGDPAIDEFADDQGWQGQLSAPQRRALFMRSFLEVALGGLDAAELAALDRAVARAYERAGITADPRTWVRPAPTLSDLDTALNEVDSSHPAWAAAHQLAARLTPFVSGSYAPVFNGSTTAHPGGHLSVFSLRDLPEELKSLATLLTLDAIWQQVTDPRRRRRRLVVVDEAWLLMREDAGARFLFRMAKSSRKHWAGLTVITQDAGDVLSSDLGRAVVANAATQILLRQAPQAIDAITEAFALTAGERQLLLAAERGCGLMVAGGSHRVAFYATASPAEDILATTDPARLMTPASGEAATDDQGRRP